MSCFFHLNINNMNSLFSLLFLGLFSTAVGPTNTAANSPQPVFEVDRTLSTIKVCTGSGEEKQCTKTTYDDGADCYMVIEDAGTATTGDDC